MSKNLANLLSYIFHPGLMPSYLIGILYFISPYIVGIDMYPDGAKLLLLLFILSYTFLIPILFVFWLYRRKTISSMTLRKRKDRHIPYLFSILSAASLVYFFYQKSSQLESTAIILSFITLVMAAIAILNIWWKVSAHSAGIAGVLGALFMLKIKYDEVNLELPFIIALLITGLVISARLKLNAHNIKQTLLGFSIGFIISIFGSLFI